jgi:hypothetical protein
VTDSITGFSGIAICRTEYLHGCIRIGVQPTELHEGKPIEAVYFDEQQLTEASQAKAGGPHDAPPPRQLPDWRR